MPNPHPLNGKWNSYALNEQDVPVLDGEIDLDIEPNGHFNRGHHRPAENGSLGQPIELELNVLSTVEIEVTEKGGLFSDYHGFLVIDPLHQNRKVLIGEYTLPDGERRFVGSEGKNPANVQDGQINGTWVATQP